MPVGITNIGNTCFLNAIIQCMRVCEPWLAFLEQLDCEDVLNCGFLRVISNSMFFPMSNRSLQTLVSNIRISLGTGQIDPTHAFQCIVENIRTQVSLTELKKPFKSLFFNSVVSTTLCGTCHVSSHRIEYTPLLFLGGHMCDDALTAFTQTFSPLKNIIALDGDNKYDCEHCRKRGLGKQIAFQTNNLTHLSSIVVMVPQHGVHYIKATEDFVWDAHKLSCVACIVHTGDDGNGHCMALVRTMNGWWICDDGLVKEIQKTTVESYSPYMFFMIKEPL